MGQRALVAYEQADGTYEVHYAHWGQVDLWIKPAIEESGERFPTPNGRKIDEDVYAECETLDEVVNQELDFCIHEAFYVVDRSLNVRAFLTFHYNFANYQDDPSDPFGEGALYEPRWAYENDPNREPFPVHRNPKGKFDGLLTSAQNLIELNKMTVEEADEFLNEQVIEEFGHKSIGNDTNIPDYSPRGGLNATDISGCGAVFVKQ